MKTIYAFLVVMGLLIFSSCKSSEILPPDDFLATATILIDSSMDENRVIKLYLDFEDINMTLHSNETNRVYLKKEKTNIQIVQKYKTASIDFDVASEKKYKLKLLKTYDNNLIIIQMKDK